MIYSVDNTEEGTKCVIVLQGKTIDCIVIGAFEYVTKNKLVFRRYSLQDEYSRHYDNILSSDIKFKK